MNIAQNKVIEAAEKLSYAEWLQVCAGINRAFDEKERSARKELKADAERMRYFSEYP